MPPKRRSKDLSHAQVSTASAPSTSAPSVSTSSTNILETETETETLPKPSWLAWKNGTQLEFLFSKLPSYLDHQDKGILGRFWPPIYDTWYKNWAPPQPTTQEIEKHGSSVNATLVFRSKNNVRIRTWFHNKSRPSSKAVKSDLKLGQAEKRKLALTQAYCTYAWDSGLRDTVIARWEEQKATYMSADKDDPPADSVKSSVAGSHIPIDFKLKIAKEVYNSLSPAEKDLIDKRREEERSKLYRPVLEITSAEERDKKLLTHQKNQPSVPKTLLRTLKNLEDQAGCVAQLLVAYIDPATGKTSCQKFCQGKTELGLDFQAFSGRVFDEVIEKSFREWALRVFGDKESKRRAMYLFSDASCSEQGAGSSSAPHPQTSPIIAAEQLIGLAPEVDTTMADEDGVPPPQAFETMGVAPAPNLIPPLFVDQPPTMSSSYSNNTVSVPIFDPPQFVSPQEVFAPPQSLEPPFVAPSNVLESLQTAPPSQALSPIVRESLVTQVVASHQIDVSPTATVSPSLVIPSPVLESSYAVISHQPVASPTVAEPSLSAPSVLESHHAVIPPQADAPRKPAPQRQTTNTPLTTGHDSHSAVVRRSSEPTGHVGGDSSGGTATATSRYRSRSKAGRGTQSRRNSIEGAPDITLSLCGSEYRPTAPPSQHDPLVTFAKNDTSAIPDASPDGLIVSSSQQSLDESQTIPVGGEASTPSTPSADELVVSSQHQYLEELPTLLTTSGTTATTSNPFFYAPRVIPTYNINRSDFPSWLLERGRLDHVLSVEAGAIWEKLIVTWLRQERRLEFGLNEKLGATLSLKKKPEILKDYFKWHHTPTKGDSVVLPGFGDEVSVWWSSIQPEWRYKNESPSDNSKDYSFILAGGRKGVYLLILCLAWWDRAHGRNMEQEKARRREAARAAGAGDTTPNFDDLHEHEHRWFNIVNDLVFVMELAQGWPVPGESTPADATMVTPVRIAPARKKRTTESGDGSLPRKKKKVS